MTDALFNESDKQKFVEFLNVIAKNASFTMNTDEIITYFKLLAHMQQVILPKIQANILEIVKVVEAEKVEKEAPSEGKKRK